MFCLFSPSEEPENHQIFDDGDHDMNSLENLMLPCEFCKDLLPADVLPHHQVYCYCSISLHYFL